MPIRELISAEGRLRNAMLFSDIETLQTLLSPDLLAIDLGGLSYGREEKLELHRSGRLRRRVIDIDVELATVRRGVAVTVVSANIAGQLDGAAFEGLFTYTRTWVRAGKRWQVLSAVGRRGHATPRMG